MLSYTLKRLMSLGIVWTVAVLVTFFAVHLVPGDPIMMMLNDQSGNVVLEARLRAQYGLDQPLLVQLFDYLRSIADGTFGLSYRYVGSTVFDVIKSGLMITPILAILALVCSVPIGVGLGVLAATRAGKWIDTIVIVALVIGISIPNFALAAVLVWLFSVNLGWLPVAGWGQPANLVLPLVVLIIGPVAVITRLTRTYMLEVLDKEYVRTARAKGVRERLVIWRHALGNTLVPLLTSVGIILGSLLSGTFIVETVFNIPGLGRIAIDSILSRDYPVTMSVVLLFTAFFTLVNLAVDLLYGFVDPRIRLEGGSK